MVQEKSAPASDLFTFILPEKVRMVYNSSVDEALHQPLTADPGDTPPLSPGPGVQSA